MKKISLSLGIQLIKILSSTFMPNFSPIRAVVALCVDKSQCQSVSFKLYIFKKLKSTVSNYKLMCNAMYQFSTLNDKERSWRPFILYNIFPIVFVNKCICVFLPCKSLNFAIVKKKHCWQWMDRYSLGQL